MPNGTASAPPRCTWAIDPLEDCTTPVNCACRTPTELVRLAGANNPPSRESTRNHTIPAMIPATLERPITAPMMATEPANRGGSVCNRIISSTLPNDSRTAARRADQSKQHPNSSSFPCSLFTRWQRCVPTNDRPAIAAILMGRFTGDLDLGALPPETSPRLCVGAHGSPALP